MTHFAVHIWAENGVDQGFIDAAEDTIENDMDPLLNFSTFAYQEDQDYFVSSSSWDELESNFANYVENKIGGVPNSYECHLLIVDNLIHGAGHSFGRSSNPGSTPFSSGEASAAGVNAAVKAFINSGCPGTGDTAFRNTVIHELIHTFGVWHDSGGIFEDQGPNDENLVTPLQTWYSNNNCGGSNDPVDTNCTLNPNTNYEEFTTSMTSCTTVDTNSYYNSNF